jgi:acetyl-CoA C-acetyltransferase
LDQAKVDAMESPPFDEHANGPAVIETYTVAFNRDGAPEQGIVVGRLGDGTGARFFANTPANSELLWAMTREEYVGRRGTVAPDPETGRNVFTAG